MSFWGSFFGGGSGGSTVDTTPSPPPVPIPAAVTAESPAYYDTVARALSRVPLQFRGDVADE